MTLSVQIWNQITHPWEKYILLVLAIVNDYYFFHLVKTLV